MDFTVGECNREIECLRTEQRLPELGGVRELYDFTVPRKPATKSSLLEVQSFRGPSSDLWTVQQWTFHRSRFFFPFPAIHPSHHRFQYIVVT